MEKFLKIVNKALFIPLWLVPFMVLISASALVYIFLNNLEESIGAYIAYVFSFYTLCVVTAFIVKVGPKKYRAVKDKIYSTSVGEKYMTDIFYRSHVSLYVSLSMNLMYIVVNVVSYFQQGSMWFTVLAVYYAILAVMRYLLLRFFSLNKKGRSLSRYSELKRCVVCSSVMLTLNFVLSGAVLMILFVGRGFEYEGMLIYVMAAYTFYTTTHAIIDLIKYRKLKSPVMTTSKMITLSAALVSMLSLETAMFSQFGSEMAESDKQLMIMLTGAGVSLTVIGLSLLMIIRSAKEMAEIKNPES